MVVQILCIQWHIGNVSMQLDNVLESNKTRVDRDSLGGQVPKEK